MADPLIVGGKYAVVNGVAGLRNWAITESLNNPVQIGSNTAGGTNRTKGVQTWSGSFGAWGAVPTMMPGEIFNFQGFVGPDGVPGSTGPTRVGQAIVDQLAITWDWTTAQILSYVLNFSGHLGLTKGTGEYADATVLDEESVCGLVPVYVDDSGEDPVDVEIKAVTTLTLTLTSANKAYNNSGTVASGQCVTGRIAGPLDWNMSINTQNAKQQLVIGDLYDFKLPVSASTFWRLQWGRIKEYGNLSPNSESGDIVTQAITVEMAAANAGVLGGITKPGAGSAWWPVVSP